MESVSNRHLSSTYFVTGPVLSSAELKETFALTVGQGQLLVVDMWKNTSPKELLPTLLNVTRPSLPILSAFAFVHPDEETHLVAVSSRNKLLGYRWYMDSGKPATYDPDQLRMQIKDTLQLIASHSSEKTKLEKRMKETTCAIQMNNHLLYELERIKQKRPEMDLQLTPTVVPTHRSGSLRDLPYLRVTLTVNETTTSNQIVHEASLTAGTWEKWIPVPMRYEIFPLRVEVGLRSSSYSSDSLRHARNSVYILLQTATFDVIDFAAPSPQEIPYPSPYTQTSPYFNNFDRASGLTRHVAELLDRSGEKRWRQPSGGHERVKSHEIRLKVKWAESHQDLDLHKSLLSILLGEHVDRPRLEKILVDASTAVFHTPYSPHLLTLTLTRGTQESTFNLTLRSEDRAIGMEVEGALLERIRAFPLEKRPAVHKISPARIQELNETQYAVESLWQAIRAMKGKPHLPWRELDGMVREFERRYLAMLRLLRTFEPDVLVTVSL
ncbi:hypothetical protein K493DRAFT_299330 [Basidiobolus meristosporus CBS 931.73]|uniref:Uncharacterized protein n=1 Tax=Basidiobolus meristosporus CBS 931.73 TaxID=1314790 RepID=A0A1Y1YP23_9FUNG|nr:hypothetical protein K493DRAFT_299330 [Basidiobolus meristosporus CBS 931.73]|eukprot:ORX99516.1 hypothetical protein K493DRAFT_299330 [Basidiobolus meristosporus CBS 931.73]